MWEWILRVGSNGRRNINLDQAEFIDMCSLSRESACNVAAGWLERALRAWLIG